MFKWFLVVLVCLSFPFSALAQESPARTHVVQVGENLYRIALQYGFSTDELARANQITNPSQIYVGQVLTIPVLIGGGEEIQAQTLTTTATLVESSQVTHIVQANEGLAGIARQYGVSLVAITQANSISNPNIIHAGQQLLIPNPSLQPPADYGQVPAPVAGREIVVELHKQSISAYENGALLKQVIVSTGLPATPTVQGNFAIYSKLPEQTMYGPGYYLPGVPWVMYFYQGYAIHGTYWHSNFGQPMSHGCVNLTSADAAWFYEFASVGTPVRVIP